MMNYWRYSSLLVLSFLPLIFSCDLRNSPILDVPDDITHDVKRIFNTKSGKSIHISEEHPIGMSLSDIVIFTEGFEHNYIDTIKDSDPILEVFLSDLDENGFEEIYIVTQSVGSGSYGKIIAIASNKDKSMTPVYIPKQDEIPHQDYSGHDTYSLENGFIVRAFEIYQDGSERKRNEIRYELVAGEAGWLLVAE